MNNKQLISIKDIIIVLFIFICLPLDAEETKKDLSPDLLGLKVKSGFFYGTSDKGDDGFLSQSEISPLQHGVSYFRFIPYIQYSGINIQFDLTAEHRSQSGGVFNSNVVYIYPRYNFNIDTSFNVFGNDFNFNVSVGNFFDRQALGGLTFLNIDDQGWFADINYYGFGIRYDKIADYLLGVGYGIDDVNILQTYYKRNFFKDNLEAKYSFAFVNYANILESELVGNFRNDHLFKLRFKDWVKATWQYSIRASSDDNRNQTSSDNSAYIFELANIKPIKWNDFKLNMKFAFRNYGRNYNLDTYKENRVDLTWLGAKNDGFYPSYYLNRSFAQWGAYSEWQTGVQAISFVGNIEYKLNWDFPVFEDIILFGAIDYNQLNIENQETQTFNFIEIGVKYQPFDSFNISLFNSNKIYDDSKSYFAFQEQAASTFRVTMNLDTDAILFKKEK
ncbi:hypothetical protein OAQ99_07015 [Candidatus Kapabacteria bacterium]|nr:hypothetical protein [Candidatus Kapabacteria bacterium]